MCNILYIWHIVKYFIDRIMSSNNKQNTNEIVGLMNKTNSNITCSLDKIESDSQTIPNQNMQLTSIPLTTDDYIYDSFNDSIIHNTVMNNIEVKQRKIDIFSNLTIDVNKDENEIEEELEIILSSDNSDAESVYDERDINVDSRYITNSPDNTEVYKKPPVESACIRQIWKQAGLGQEATLYQIEMHLIDWANSYATLITKDYNITEIQWKCGKTGTRYITTWQVFIKMVLCGCNHNSFN